jgi:DNA-binding NarL/FixJ family response regulator
MASCEREHLTVTLTAVVVDDHPGFRAIARQMLEDAGFEVVGEAADGAGARDLVVLLRPRLLLLDVQLPDIDGFDVARDLARTAPGTVVVLTSARNADDFGKHRMATCAASGFITKAELSGAAVSAVLEGTA